MTVLFLCLTHKWDFAGKDLNSLNSSFLSLMYTFQCLKVCILETEGGHSRNKGYISQ